MKLVLIAIVLAFGCSKSNEDKAKEVGKNVEDKAKEVGGKVSVEAKKDEKLAEKKIAIGAPVDVTEAMKALCNATAPTPPTAAAYNAAVADVMQKSPNPEVLRVWGSLRDTPMADRPAMLQPLLERSGQKACPFLEGMKSAPAK